MNDKIISMQELIDLLKGLKIEYEKDNITENMSLFDDLGISSFDMLVAICEIEKRFNIFLPINKCNTITTIRDLYDYIIFETKAIKKN